VLFALSILSATGSGVGVFARSFLPGLVCLGGRGGGGNSCSPGPAMFDPPLDPVGNPKITEELDGFSRSRRSKLEKLNHGRRAYDAGHSGVQEYKMYVPGLLPSLWKCFEYAAKQ